jgi:hypothetical protein
MNRIVWVAAALATLAVSGAAVAHLRPAAVGTASATFTASTVSHLQTRSYTCAGDTIEITTARYTGTATSSTSDLAGAAELRVLSTYNATKKLGWVDGSLRIDASDDNTRLRFTAINSDGKLDGWLRGHAGRGDGTVFGSFSSSFTAAGGFTGGAIGSGTGANAALLLKRTGCKASEQKPSVRLFVRGTVDSVSSSSISVKPNDGSATVTCAVGSGSPRVDRIAKGDKVEATCVQLSGALTLARIEKRR